ncbi:MAG: hypothetical protein VX808_06665, partial [Actinomycetota bacterium]|nr:hypothetical protein [Actinomycetota bacterium]
RSSGFQAPDYSAPVVTSTAMSERYDPQTIEARWQQRWSDEGTTWAKGFDPKTAGVIIED